MRVQTRGTHLNGVRTRRYVHATKLRKSARKMSAWSQQMYRMHVSPFRLKVGATRGLVETTHKGTDCSTVRIQLWRVRIRTGRYQVNSQTLAACILLKEARFFHL